MTNNTNELKTEKYMVFYIDLIGTKEIIHSDKDNEMLNKIQICMKQLIDTIPIIMPSTDIQGCKIKVFSDNIIIAIPSNFNRTDNNHPVIAINRMHALVGFIQRYFLENNLLSRGAVTYGDFFIDDVFVWGAALIRSYTLENSIALYPRVIVDDNIIKIAESLIIENHNINNLEMNKIKKDFDGIYFFDYLNFPEDPDVRDVINKSMLNIEQKIENETDKRILQKLHWHKKYLLSCKSKWK